MSTLVHTATLPALIDTLTARDTTLAALVARDGPPPLWMRAPGFATLVHIMLEQQVSLRSAQAAFDRLVAVTGRLTPAALLALDDVQMLQVGFSRQKREYARGLALAVSSGTLDLDALATHDDGAVRAQLTALRGIGRWTADIYLLMVLGRPDIWPTGDLAIVLAVQDAWQLTTRPDHATLEAIAAPWQPWRAVAARILWHAYLSQPVRRRGIG